jgi:hypothetical protein
VRLVLLVIAVIFCFLVLGLLFRSDEAFSVKNGGFSFSVGALSYTLSKYGNISAKVWG